MSPETRGVTAFASAQWDDYLSWEAPSNPVTLVFNLAVHGTRYGNWTSPHYLSQAGAVATAYFTFFALSLTGASDNPGLSAYNAVGHHRPEEPSFHEVDDVFFTYLFTVEPGQTGTMISMYLNNLAAASALDQGTTAAAGTNFLNTAKLTDLRFLDESGSDITSQMNYSFQNGTQIYPNATVTPEPVSLALLGTGLAGLAAMRLRRRPKNVDLT